MSRKLKDSVAVVTGSSRGIGAAMAQLFAQEGAKVALVGREVTALKMVQGKIRALGGIARLFTADVTRFADIERMRREVEDAFGPIGLLVANAGGSYVAPGPIEELSEAGWHAAVDNNLTSAFLTIKSVLPGMKERRSGNIITVSSQVGHRPHPVAPIPYAAAKAGIEILTKNLASQAGPFGVRVNCVAPGTVMTERNREKIPAAQLTSLTAAHPLGRLGSPADIAQAALFLASDDSSWVSGIVLDVAGGTF